MKKPKLPSSNGKSPKAKMSSADFEALRDFMRGYLNQDFADEYGSATSAAEAFCEDADASEVREVAMQWQAFIKSTAGQSVPAINQRMASELGAGWSATDATDLDSLSKIFAKFLPS